MCSCVRYVEIVKPVLRSSGDVHVCCSGKGLLDGSPV